MDTTNLIRITMRSEKLFLFAVVEKKKKNIYI